MIIKIQFNKSKDAKTKVRPIRKLQTKIKIRKLAEILPSSCKARVWKYLHRNLYVLKRNFWVAIKQGREYIMLFYLNIFACSGRCALLRHLLDWCFNPKIYSNKNIFLVYILPPEMRQEDIWSKRSGKTSETLTFKFLFDAML